MASSFHAPNAGGPHTIVAIFAIVLCASFAIAPRRFLRLLFGRTVDETPPERLSALRALAALIAIVLLAMLASRGLG